MRIFRVVALCSLVVSFPVFAATFIVSSAADSGPGTLRQAILDANALPAGPHTIRFAIGTSAQVINLLTALPPLTAANTIIDGKTQPGSTATPRIELNGAGVGGTAAGLEIHASGATVRGLFIHDFFRGVAIVGPAAIGNTIRENSIHRNSALGIDLGADGVNANDALDADAGPNNLQNHPAITSAANLGPLIITGTLNSLPNTPFIIDFYRSGSCDGSGFGEGEAWAGGLRVTTNAFGTASIDSLFYPTPPAGVLTATATNEITGDTSEFSPCVPIIPPPPPPIISLTRGAYAVYESEGFVTIGVGRGPAATAASVQYRTEAGTATPDRDYLSVTGEVEWAPGETGIKTFTVPITLDALSEGEETFRVVLFGHSGGAPFPPSEATVIIRDDALGAIPAASEWALLAMALMLAVAATVVLKR